MASADSFGSVGDDRCFHYCGWLCQQRLTGINLRHDLIPVDIYFEEKRNDFEISYSTRLAEQK